MTLPNFLVIGAGKAGTTSLYRYFLQHPDVYMSPVKEPSFFCDEDELMNLPAIRSRHAYERLFAGVNGERAIGEASPKYLNTIAGVDRIHATLPGVRLIVSLRNPADRAWSSFLQRSQNATEMRTAEETLLPGNFSFESSFYYPRLRRYFDRFPGEQIKVILFDDLTARTRDTMRELFRFLEIDPDTEVDTSVRHNPAITPRFRRLNYLIAAAFRLVRPFTPEALLFKGYGRRLRQPLFRAPDPFPPALRRRLLEQYRDDILATGDLIGRDLSRWLE